MVRKIIHIDEEKCNGCGLCAEACHEGAIDIVDGKAKLMRENFCDGFGDCLPNCPTGAITFEEREAPAYDEAAVKKAQEAKKMEDMKHVHHEGGRMSRFKDDAVRTQRRRQFTGHHNKVGLPSCTVALPDQAGPYTGAIL